MIDIFPNACTNNFKNKHLNITDENKDEFNKFINGKLDE